MSQDGKSSTALSGQTAGFITIAVGFAILISSYVTDNPWLIIPVVLIEVGFYGLVMGAFAGLRGERAPPGGFRWGTDPAYTMFWGSLLVLIGALWLVNDIWPNNIPALAASFLIWIGIAVMILSKKGATKTRVW
ncbi:MAG: hypothetical protein ISF22_00140 [Methanomassiliicoccus sp.]|nr:hypothetical protein [Methanomassiliicoccus sp.]